MKKLALVAAPLFHLRLEAMATNRGEAHIGKHVAKTGKVKENNNGDLKNNGSRTGVGF